MRGLYQRDGIYYVRIPRGDGKYDRLSLKTSDAKKAAREAESMLSAYKGGADANALWQHLAERYKKEHFSELRPGTRATYTWAIVALSQVLYDKPIRQIDNPMLDRFVKARFDAGLSRGGVRSELAVLSSMMSFAEGKMLIERNPVPRYIKAHPRKVRRGEPRVRWLTQAEEEKVLLLLAEYVKASDKGPEARMMLMRAVIVAIDTGLRVSEIRQMEWKEVNFDREQVYVPKERAKSGKDRWVPLLPRTLALLKKMHADKVGPWVFPKDAGERRVPGPRVNFDKALRHFAGTYIVRREGRPDETAEGPAVKAGIEAFSWHDLRRTCGCRLLQDRKISMELVSKWLGHSSITVTERHYAFLTVDNLHEAVGTNKSSEASENMTLEMTQDHRAHGANNRQRLDFVGTASRDRTGDL